MNVLSAISVKNHHDFSLKLIYMRYNESRARYLQRKLRRIHCPVVPKRHGQNWPSLGTMLKSANALKFISAPSIDTLCKYLATSHRTSIYIYLSVCLSVCLSANKKTKLTHSLSLSLSILYSLSLSLSILFSTLSLSLSLFSLDWLID